MTGNPSRASRGACPTIVLRRRTRCATTLVSSDYFTLSCLRSFLSGGAQVAGLAAWGKSGLPLRRLDAIITYNGYNVLDYSNATVPYLDFSTPSTPVPTAPRPTESESAPLHRRLEKSRRITSSFCRLTPSRFALEGTADGGGEGRLEDTSIYDETGGAVVGLDGWNVPSWQLAKVRSGQVR